LSALQKELETHKHQLAKLKEEIEWKHYHFTMQRKN
jgi:hypothetical protein